MHNTSPGTFQRVREILLRQPDISNQAAPPAVEFIVNRSRPSELFPATNEGYFEGARSEEKYAASILPVVGDGGYPPIATSQTGSKRHRCYKKAVQ